MCGSEYESFPITDPAFQGPAHTTEGFYRVCYGRLLTGWKVDHVPKAQAGSFMGTTQTEIENKQ
jgi:hypothetical protein